MDHKAPEHKQFTDTVSDSTLQRHSKKLLLLEFYHRKEEYSELCESSNKMLIHFLMKICLTLDFLQSKLQITKD